MSNKFSFIDEISLKYASNVISKIKDYTTIDEIIYDKPQISEVVNNTEQSKITKKDEINHEKSSNFGDQTHKNIQQQAISQEIPKIIVEKDKVNDSTTEQKLKENVTLNTKNNLTQLSNQTIELNLTKTSNNRPIFSKSDSISKHHQQNTSPIKKWIPLVDNQIESKKITQIGKQINYNNPLKDKKIPLIKENLVNSTSFDPLNKTNFKDKVLTNNAIEKQMYKNIEEKPMKDFNSINQNQFIANDSQDSNSLNPSSNITEHTNPVSVIDAFENSYDINSLDNIININDVYEDLGKTFQDDLFNQYNKLDKSVNYDEPKYSYLPKRRIKELLFTKYGINNEEFLNDLYSMAFNNKWKEIDVEHWLLNPANILFAKSKYGDLGSLTPKKEEEKEKEEEVINNEALIDSEEEQKIEEINNAKSKNDDNENIQKIEVVQSRNKKGNKFKRSMFKNNKCEHSHMYECHDNYHVKPKEHNHHFHSMVHNDSVKDDLKSVLIEENYRKMQFDFQTEILKNHIDAKFSNFGASPNFNQLGFYPNSLSHEKYNQSNGKNFVSVKEFNEKIEKLFDNEKNKIKEEISLEINDLKDKFIQNEKNIYESLDFIRQEIKDNEKNLRDNFNNSIGEIKSEISTTLVEYMNEINNKQKKLTDVINEKQELLVNAINNKQSELFEQFRIFNKENNKNQSLDIIVNELKRNFGGISEEMSLLKNKINNQHIENNNELKDLRSDINNQLNLISEEMRNNITNIYSEIDALSEFVYNSENSNSKNEFIQSNNLDDKNYSEYKKSYDESLLNNDSTSNLKVDENIDETTQPLKAETFDNEFGVIETIRTNDNSFDVPNYEKYQVQNYIDKKQDNEENHNVNNESTKLSVVDYESFANHELENANFSFLDQNYNTNNNDLNDLNHQENISKNNQDFYSSFLDANRTTTGNNKMVSNFDSNKTINSLDIEQTFVNVQEEKNEKDDIQEKLSRIDEIIKNSIDELNDIKDYVKEEDARIDESIKLFEKVK